MGHARLRIPPVTETESAYLKALALAVADLQTRLTHLEAFVLSVNRRLTLNEAGLAIYQVEDDRRDLH